MNQPRNQYLIYLILVILAAGVTFALVGNHNNDTRFGNAMEEIGEGVEDAGRELDPNRTPGEKFGDAVDDLGDSIQDATDSN